MLARIVALGLALMLPHAAFAAALAPAKASDLAVVYTKDLKATCTGGGRPFDTRVLSDGTEEPFVIPPKRVFVITSFAFTLGSDAPAGQAAAPTVTARTGATSVPLVIGSGVTDPDGDVVGTVVLPTGVAVRPGPTLCLFGGTTQNGVLHGYFAKDK
jgi:hypothetical protein